MVQAAKLIGAGSALIALAGVGAGIGIVFGALIQAASRNPTMAKALMGYALLGFALWCAYAPYIPLPLLLPTHHYKRENDRPVRCHSNLCCWDIEDRSVSPTLR
jgi:F-type H+-transporting ATPase subunit c